MENQFKTKVGEFEGPLDLLLQLIEKRKLHISDVSLSQVTDDYVTHIKGFENFPKEEVANFLVIASTLLLIKSLTLLPTIETTPEETSDISDLKKRLALYEKIKNSVEKIKIIFGQKFIFFREESKITEPIFTPSTDIAIQGLHQAIHSVIANLPKPEKIPEVVVKKVISLEEVIGHLTKRIQTGLSMRFSDFTREHKTDKVGIIVSFLGMLELVKEGIIEVKQDNLYEDIQMENAQMSTPRY